LIFLLLCPECHGPLEKNTSWYSCRNCNRTFSDKSGISQFNQANPGDEVYFPDDSFEILYDSEEKNFWFRVRNQIIGSTVTRYLTPNSRLLEVGCGTGYVSCYLKKLGYHVECADLFFEALQFCRKRDAGDHYYQYNLSDRIFIEEFDAVCAFDVIEHIEDDESVLKTVHDSLKPGGFLFITVPADKCLWSAMDIYAGHKRRYSRQELRKKIEGNGFKVVKMSYFMTFLYPFILLSRKLSLRTGDMDDETMEKRIHNEEKNQLQPNGLLNTVFFFVFSLEVPLLHSFNFPFGSSLLCVAVKET
jgi:2-polyprenyl-3-methyl-5-hydroxy-6-metoxy-1,4-benzoquinol methylase